MKEKTLSKVTTKTLEAGIFFGSMVPGRVFAQVDCANPKDDIEKGLCGGAPPELQGRSLFDAGGIFERVTSLLLFLIGAISVIMLIIGGFRYVVSGGDATAVENAKNTILYALIGIVIAFLAFAIIQFVLGELQPPTTP